MRVLDHEMRAPLATSLMQIRAAEAAMGNDNSIDSARAALAAAASRLNTLSLVVRRTIQLETKNQIDLFPERIDLRQFATDLLRRMRATGTTAWSRVEIRAREAVVGDWDPTAVEQVLENLLSNALKFGREAPVVLTIAPEDHGVRFSVEDEGSGIESKYRERIFGRFVRDPSARAIPGLGIGLWVVRHLIRAHGGRLLLRSRPGKGTVVDVWLPQLASYSASPASKLVAPTSWSQAILGRRASVGPMRSKPCSAANRTRSPTL